MKLETQFAGYGNLLGTYLRHRRASVALVAALLLGTIGLQLVNPQIVRYFIDTAQSGGTTESLLGAATAFIVIGLAQQVLALATSYFSLDLGWNATNALRKDLAAHLLKLDMPFHKKHTPGELIARVDGDVNALANFFARFIVQVAANMLLVAAVLILLFREDWRAGAALSLYTLVTFAVLAGLQGYGTRRWASARQADAERFGFIEERVGGTEDIQGVGAQAYVLHGLYARMREVLRHGRASYMVDSLSSAVTNLLYVGGYGLGLAIGAYLYTQGAVTIGTAFVIVYYISILGTPLEVIRHQAQDLQQAGASVRRVSELLSLRSTVEEGPGAPLPAGPLSVVYSHVSFAYNDEPQNQPRQQAENSHNEKSSPGQDGPPVLCDLSFALAPGRVLGLLGRTGSGKTTLTRLLFRLYDPTSGSILLGGEDLRTLSFAQLRSRVGMVTQDVQLFQASIRDNISLFDQGIDDLTITSALEELGLLEWINSMPGGLDAQLEAGGGGLSAGEAQLLAFARILLKDPGLVILDEAASRLDPITEARLERAISRLLERRTGIIIAHRLDTVQRADDIMILESGRVAEIGQREGLASDPTSRFSSLLRTGLEGALV